MTNTLQRGDIIIFLEEAEDERWKFGDMAQVTSAVYDYDEMDNLLGLIDASLLLVDDSKYGFGEDDEPFYTIYDPTKDIQGLTPVENAIAQAVMFFDKDDDIPQYAAMVLVDALKRIAGA